MYSFLSRAYYLSYTEASASKIIETGLILMWSNFIAHGVSKLRVCKLVENVLHQNIRGIFFLIQTLS